MTSDRRSDDADDGDEGRRDEGAPRRRRASSRTDPSRQIEEASADLGALVAAHPAGAVATALGVGYVLGGGMFTRLTSRLLRLALRVGVQFAVLPVLEQELATILGAGKTTNGTGPGALSERGGLNH